MSRKIKVKDDTPDKVIESVDAVDAKEESEVEKKEPEPAPETAETGDELLEMQQKLDEVKEQLRESQDKVLRMAADFENTKKRLIRERETAVKYAEENILKELLPTIDNLERALDQGGSAKDSSSLLEGVDMTLQGMITALEKFGLKSIAGKGEVFDPNFHEAMVMEASKDVPENNIIQEYEKGYMFKDRLLRASKVVVSKGDVEE